MAAVPNNGGSSSRDTVFDGDFIDLTESEKNTEDDDCVCIHLNGSPQVKPMDKDISAIINQKLRAASLNLNFCESLANSLKQRPKNNIIIHDNKVLKSAKKVTESSCGFVMKKSPKVDPNDVIVTPSPVEVRQKKFPVVQNKEIERKESDDDVILLDGIEDIVDLQNNSEQPKIINFELKDKLGLPKKTVKKTADSKKVQTHVAKNQPNTTQNESNIIIEDVFTMAEHAEVAVQTPSASEDVICLSDEENDPKTSSEPVKMATIRDVSKLVDPSKAVQSVQDICETESAVAAITSNKDEDGRPVYILLCPLDPKTGMASVDGQVKKILALIPKDSALVSKVGREQISDVSSSSEISNLIKPPSLVTPATLQKQVAGDNLPPLVRLQSGATLTKQKKFTDKETFNHVESNHSEKLTAKEAPKVSKSPVILNTFSLSSETQTLKNHFTTNVQTPIKRRITTQRNYNIPAPVSHSQVTNELTLSDLLHEREEEGYASPITLNDLVKDNEIMYKVNKQLVHQVPNQSLSLRKVKVFDPAQVEDRSLFKVRVPQSPNQTVIRPEEKSGPIPKQMITQDTKQLTSRAAPKKKIMLKPIRVEASGTRVVRPSQLKKKILQEPIEVEASGTQVVRPSFLEKILRDGIGVERKILQHNIRFETSRTLQVVKPPLPKSPVALERQILQDPIGVEASPTLQPLRSSQPKRILRDPVEVDCIPSKKKAKSGASQNQDVDVRFPTDPPAQKKVREDPIGVESSIICDKSTNSGPWVFTPVDINKIINKGKEPQIPGRCKLEHRLVTTIHHFRGFTTREKMRCPSFKDYQAIIKKNQKDIILLKKEMKKRDESNFISCGGSSEFFLPEVKTEPVYPEEQHLLEEQDDTIDPEDLPTINEVISRVNAEVLALKLKHKGTNKKTDKALELIKKGLEFIKNMSHGEEPQKVTPARKRTAGKDTSSPPNHRRKQTIEKITPSSSKPKRQKQNDLEDDEVQYVGHVRARKKRAKTQPATVTSLVVKAEEVADEQLIPVNDSDLFLLKKVHIIKPDVKVRRRRRRK